MKLHSQELLHVCCISQFRRVTLLDWVISQTTILTIPTICIARFHLTCFYTVKAGNYKQAIKHYYWVIFNLKGISNQESFRGHAVPGSVTPTSKITELENDDGDDGQIDDDEDDDEEGNTAKDTGKLDEEKYSFEAVKKTIAACYVNMAICHAKNNDWAKCKRCADE